MVTLYVENDNNIDNSSYDYVIYTDGGYSLINDVGAFAFVILDGKGENVILRKAWKITHETNNRGELKAIMAALYYLPNDANNILICSDSQYALKTFAGIYNGSANSDLIDWYDKFAQEHDIYVTYKWVRGHSGNKWNDLCDRMCDEAAGMDLNAEFEKYKKWKKGRKSNV